MNASAVRSLVSLKNILILFGTDLSPTSLAALPLAVSLAPEHQAQLTLLWLVHPEIQSLSKRRRIKTTYETQLQNLVPKETKRWCQTEAVLDFGLAAEGILQFADRQQTDLVVLGVGGTGVFGSASSHIHHLRHTLSLPRQSVLL